jgi:hypothetical protein
MSRRFARRLFALRSHSASVQVFADGDTRSRLIWIVDVLPHEIAPYVDGQMEQAALTRQKALGRRAAWDGRLPACINVISLTEDRTGVL